MLTFFLLGYQVESQYFLKAVKWLETDESEEAQLLAQAGMILFSGHPDEYKNLKTSGRFSDTHCVEFIKAMAWTPIQTQREMFQVVDQSDELPDTSVVFKHKGLQNIGNTCYMASCL